MAPGHEKCGNIFVENLIFLFDHAVQTLFDSGTSHLFISASVAESLHLDTSLVMDPIVVSNPNGGSAHLSMIYRDLRVSTLGVGLGCNAYVLDFMGYGLILGMDWLARYGAILNCESG